MSSHSLSFSLRATMAGVFLAVFCLFPRHLVCAEPQSVSPRVALVLEGGGALGLAHVGVIKVLEEVGIPVDIVVGTSMGSIVGGLYAYGYNASELETIVRTTEWGKLFSEAGKSSNESWQERQDGARFAASFAFTRKGFSSSGGLLSGRKVLSYMDSLVLASGASANFDDLPREFRAVAADIKTGETVVIGSGSLSEAMRSSMSIPGVFSPFRMDGRDLIDGGVVDNLPVDVARKLGADIVIAVDLSTDPEHVQKELDRDTFALLGRTLDIFVRSNVLRQLPNADHVITVHLDGYSTASFSQAGAILSLGEAAARKDRPELEALRARIGRPPRTVEKPVAVPVQKIVVNGGVYNDTASIMELFSPCVGTVPVAALLEPMLAKIERKGLYQSVRLRLEAGDLVIDLDKKNYPNNTIRFGLSSSSTWAETVSSRVVTTVGVSLRNLVFDNSELALYATVFDTMGVELIYRQFYTRYLHADTSIRYARDYSSYVSDISGITVSQQYLSEGSSASQALGWNLFPGCELAAFGSLDYVTKASYPGITSKDYPSSYGISGLRFSLQRLDSPVFPMDGIRMETKYQTSIPGLSSDYLFSTVESSGAVLLSFGSPFSMAVLWRIGTDFSQEGDGKLAAPPYYKMDLADRGLFPEPMTVSERIGSHVAGIGLDMKFSLSRFSRDFGFPLFLTLAYATGGAMESFDQLNDAKSLLQYTINMGIGFKVNDGLGLHLRGGTKFEPDGDLTPYVSLDVGSLGY